MNGGKIMQTQYEINDETMAILTIDKNYSEVYEMNEHYIVEQASNKIMEDSCRYFGSSLEGRRKGTEYMIGVNYKAPIIVEESKEIIFFPTSSTRENSNWIRLKYIKSYYRDGDVIFIVFENGTKIAIKTSYGIIDNQVLRATRLESALRGRKTSKKTVM